MVTADLKNGHSTKNLIIYPNWYIGNQDPEGVLFLGKIMDRIKELQLYFTPSRGWELVSVKPGEIDMRETVPGSIQRCADRRFGVNKRGYKPEAVPRGPAWLGALDGIEALLPGRNPLRRTKDAAERIRALGFEPADHGDFTLGKDGCAFKRERRAGHIPGVNPAFSARVEDFIKRKVKAEHVVLREAQFHARGFVLNNREFTTVMPEDGKYYVNDEWLARLCGIKPEQYLRVIAACGELLLPREDRKLFIV